MKNKPHYLQPYHCIYEKIDDYQVRFAMPKKLDERHQKWLISDEEREYETFVAADFPNGAQTVPRRVSQWGAWRGF
jgi:hypothetical protein